jgi:hypothetical protein
MTSAVLDAGVIVHTSVRRRRLLPNGQQKEWGQIQVQCKFLRTLRSDRCITHIDYDIELPLSVLV